MVMGRPKNTTTHCKGAALLVNWLDKKQMSYKDFSGKLDMNPQHFHRYLTTRVPSTKAAVKIQELTGGQVKVEHWLQD